MQTSNKDQLPLPIWIYIGLWIFFAYLFVQILFFTVESPQNPLLSGMYFIQFGVHEASHLFAMFLPQIFTAAAGSIGEVAFAILIVIAAIKGRAYFAAIFGALWVMLAMNSAGRYMADARTQQIPLVGFSNQPTHDWNFVFGQLGWLQADIAIGTVIRGIGDVVGVVALGIGIWLIVKKITKDENPIQESSLILDK